MARQVMAAAMTERDLQDCVVALARVLHFEVYHTFLSVRSSPGFPDLLLARLGADGRTHMLAVELKSERGVVTEAQQQWLDLFAGAGIAAHVWRPADWLDGTIERALREGQYE